MFRIALAAATLFLAVSATASAGQTSAVEEGIYVQEQNVVHAVMTPRERRMISRERQQVYAMERRYKADGVYTRSERRQVAAAQRRLNAHIRAARG